jgi:hypothetical protein
MYKIADPEILKRGRGSKLSKVAILHSMSGNLFTLL